VECRETGEAFRRRYQPRACRSVRWRWHYDHSAEWPPSRAQRLPQGAEDAPAARIKRL